MVFADWLVTVILFQWNKLVLWALAIQDYVQPWIFPANYSLVLQLWNYSTLNDLQYMVFIISHLSSNTLTEHVTLGSFICSQVYSRKVDNCVQTKSMSIHTLLHDWISENHLYSHNDKYLKICSWFNLLYFEKIGNCSPAILYYSRPTQEHSVG